MFSRKVKQTVSILHRRPNKYLDPRIKFLKVYTVEAKDNVDFEKIMRQAFTEAHPNWPILSIKVTPNG
jgi:hypothetical protein